MCFKKSKIMAIFLVGVCILGGCGNPEKTGFAGREGKETDEKSGGSFDENSAGQSYEVFGNANIKGEITVSNFFEDEFLNTAARKFMEKYPDVKVVINDYAKDIENPSEKDYQTQVNTKLMSKDAEDIIVNSFLPVSKYSDMGVFEDLSSYIENTPELNDENHFMNVIESARQEEGAIYLLPFTARFEVLCFDSTLLNEDSDIEKTINNKEVIGFSEAMELSRKLLASSEKQNAYLTNLMPVQYIIYMLRDRLNEFIDVKNKKVQIDTPEYKELIASVKQMEEEGLFLPNGVDFYNTEIYMASNIDWDFQAAGFFISPSDSELSMPFCDNEGNVKMNANYSLMLNSESQNKEAAWEFIRFLLSEEMQSEPSVPAVPVNRKGFERAVERQYNFYSESGRSIGEYSDFQLTMKKWMESINRCDLLDESMVALIMEENEKYLEGSQTADETARQLQRKLEQYFNE